LGAGITSLFAELPVQDKYLLSHHVIASDFCEAIPEFSVEIASSAQNASSQ
jgi:hypothetical protein